MGEWGKPTPAMIDYLMKLCTIYEERGLGLSPYDPCDIEEMDFDEVKEAIDEIKCELGFD